MPSHGLVLALIVTGGVPLVRGVVHRGLIEPAKAVDHRRLLAAADATDNPHVVSLALLAYGYAAAAPILAPRITFVAEA
jgi:hypothetical protein